MSASLILGLVLSCAQPHVDPKTGDVTDGTPAAALAGTQGGHDDHGCAPAGGPKPEVPTQPAPAPEPEKPPVSARGSEPIHRDQPCPGDKPAAAKHDPAASDTAANGTPPAPAA